MRNKDIVEWKIRSRGLVRHVTESFLNGEGLNQKLQMKIYSSLFKRITDGDLETKPPVAGRFFEIFLKKGYFNAFGSHFERVQNHLKEVDYYHLKAN